MFCFLHFWKAFNNNKKIILERGKTCAQASPQRGRGRESGIGKDSQADSPLSVELEWGVSISLSRDAPPQKAFWMKKDEGELHKLHPSRRLVSEPPLQTEQRAGQCCFRVVYITFLILCSLKVLISSRSDKKGRGNVGIFRVNSEQCGEERLSYRLFS